MKRLFRFFFSLILLFTFFASLLPCGPAFVTPVFEYKFAPENPYENFAAGRIGILKPTYRRVVLFAAYRYLNGGSFAADEQKALVDVWNAEFNNQEFEDDDVGEAVKLWVKERKAFLGDEKELPDIYTEREYGGYDFFPNCTKNSFEVAADTLKQRSLAGGADNADVKEWIRAQDRVFANCASGVQLPEPPNQTMPEWLQKDRAYQIAAANFYAMNYEAARSGFAEIAQDQNSPWQETAAYLIGRTLIRQASLSKDEQKARQMYADAESHLYRLSLGGGRYADAAERLLGLVKYRLQPEQRIRELAQILSYQGGGENFRQNLIDYTWLMDKFEAETLAAEEKRKEALKAREPDVRAPELTEDPSVNANITDPESKKDANLLEIYLYGDDYSQNWTIYLRPEATDAEAVAEAEKTTGFPLTEKLKERLLASKRSSYALRFSQSQPTGYQGGYWGEEEKSLSLLPPFLRADDLTDWLFTYQIDTPEAYQYALERLRQTGSNLWLATAISKAKSSSAGLSGLLDAADKTDRFSPAYPTVAYHRARLLLETGRRAEAKKLLDDVLTSTLEIPVSSRNQFLDLRVGLGQTLDEFFRFSLKKPFAFQFDGRGRTIEEIIAESKAWYDPKHETVSREEYEQETEKRFSREMSFKDSLLIDDLTMLVINRHFPLEVFLTAAARPELPEYLRERFLKTAFVRALLLNKYALAEKLAADFVKLEPAQTVEVSRFLAAGPADKFHAALFLILKNENATPYLAAGFGAPTDQPVYASRWWCAPYDIYYENSSPEGIDPDSLARPDFLTAAQSQTAKAEMTTLKKIGDAPIYLGRQVLEWARLRPNDKRVPESLFIVYQANGWDKYGCGGDRELRRQAADTLKNRFPASEWAQRVVIEEP